MSIQKPEMCGLGMGYIVIGYYQDLVAWPKSFPWYDAGKASSHFLCLASRSRLQLGPAWPSA